MADRPSAQQEDLAPGEQGRKVSGAARRPSCMTPAALIAAPTRGALRSPPIPEQYRERIEPSFFSTALIVSDPPTHTGYRKAGNTQFTRGRIRSFEPKIRAIANALIDGFIDDERCDLMDQ